MKKKIVFVLALAAIVFVSMSPAHLFARWKKASPRPTATVDTNDRITALHLASVTVTLSNTQESREYQVTPATKVTINGQLGALNGLAVGMDVKVTTAPNQPTMAATIDAKTVKK